MFVSSDCVNDLEKNGVDAATVRIDNEADWQFDFRHVYNKPDI